MKKKAIIYMRTACELQAEPNHAMIYQQRTIKDFCKKNKIEIIKEIKEVKAGSFENGGTIKTITKWMIDNRLKPEYIIAADRTRFSRSFVQFNNWVSHFKSFGIEIISVKN